ncbi:MAG TPA: hypothetical protein VMS75_12425 [Terriglobales bacterium]|nr:hypothetical protein [Terriglobales bacterium]
MNRVLKVVLIFLAVDAVGVGLYFGVKAVGGRSRSPQDEYAWTTVDESYQPRNAVEEFIKSDAVQKGLLPVYIKDYGRNEAVLKKFRGANVAGANEAVLEMAFRGLQDWMLVDLMYKNEKERQVLRTMLYVELGGRWRVGDSGGLMR